MQTTEFYAATRHSPPAFARHHAHHAARPPRRSGRSTARATCALVVTLALSCTRGKSDTPRGRGAVATDATTADSVAERHADSVIARAVREQPPFDSLRAALTPTAYARDTAFASSVLAEDRILNSSECREGLVEAHDAEREAAIARGASGESSSDPRETPPTHTEAEGCLEQVLRRERPLVTAADSARDSVRLAVRARFRRGARAMRDAGLALRRGARGVGDDARAAAYDPGPDPRFPGPFDVGRTRYHFPDRERRATP